MGYKIKEIREMQGMSQEALAEKSGISRTTISALENNQLKNTSTNTLFRIAEALGTSINQLFFADPV